MKIIECRKTRKELLKEKIYELIGRAVVYTALYVSAVAFFVWAFLQNTVY